MTLQCADQEMQAPGCTIDISNKQARRTTIAAGVLQHEQNRCGLSAQARTNAARPGQSGDNFVFAEARHGGIGLTWRPAVGL